MLCQMLLMQGDTLIGWHGEFTAQVVIVAVAVVVLVVVVVVVVVVVLVVRSWVRYRLPSLSLSLSLSPCVFVWAASEEFRFLSGRGSEVLALTPGNSNGLVACLC